MADGAGPSTWHAVTTILGLVQAGFFFVVGWLWSLLRGSEARTERQFAAVWTAINAERTAAQASRERMLERLSDIPTKADIASLESRLVTMLAARRDGGSD